MTSSTVPLTGSIVALVTPMHEDGSVDYPALRKLIDWHIQEGTDCIGVVGTTGESPTVNVEEHCEIIRVAVEQAAKRVPIMAGCGANSTAEAIELAKFAKKVGADSQLQVVPYYNKPTQEGQYQHFKAIAEATGDLPIVLYNVPGRSVADMLHDTVLRLAQVPGIVGIKEATGNIERAQWLIRDLPRNFALYSGDDPTAVALMLCGGHGNISVTANVAPRLMHELCVAATAGNARRAMEIQLQLMPVHKQLFVEANPIPVKWALARMGLCGGTMRLPMTPLSQNAGRGGRAPCAPQDCCNNRSPSFKEDSRVNQTARLGLLGLTIALSACSVLEGEKIDYKSAAKGSTLEVPPDLSQLSRETRAMPCRGRGVGQCPASRSGRPADRPADGAGKMGDVRIERNGNQRWLVVSRPADKLWEPVRSFGWKTVSRWRWTSPTSASWKPTGPKTAPRFPRTSSAAPWARCSTRCIPPANATNFARAWNVRPTAAPKFTSATAA